LPESPLPESTFPEATLLSQLAWICISFKLSGLFLQGKETLLFIPTVIQMCVVLLTYFDSLYLPSLWLLFIPSLLQHLLFSDVYWRVGGATCHSHEIHQWKTTDFNFKIFFYCVS